ncbi:hypothetical protein O3P69_012690 [Scylla paramamosain]|uniref:Uncharacterized protein n=1 Tax=Scylla paramamosain TaxID=85552 RepID=A0AAW0SJQ8_SCYPA
MADYMPALLQQGEDLLGYETKLNARPAPLPFSNLRDLSRQSGWDAGCNNNDLFQVTASVDGLHTQAAHRPPQTQIQPLILLIGSSPCCRRADNMYQPAATPMLTGFSPVEEGSTGEEEDEEEESEESQEEEEGGKKEEGEEEEEEEEDGEGKEKDKKEGNIEIKNVTRQNSELHALITEYKVTPSEEKDKDGMSSCENSEAKCTDTKGKLLGQVATLTSEVSRLEIFNENFIIFGDYICIYGCGSVDNKLERGEPCWPPHRRMSEAKPLCRI